VHAGTSRGPTPPLLFLLLDADEVQRAALSMERSEEDN